MQDPQVPGRQAAQQGGRQVNAGGHTNTDPLWVVEHGLGAGDAQLPQRGAKDSIDVAGG